MVWLGASLPVLNWLSFSLIGYAHIPARALTGGWFLLALTGAFWIGAAVEPRGLFRGLALGLSLSSLVAVAQAMGWTGIASFNLPAGLLHNSALHAAALALVISALAVSRDWRYIPALIPGFVLANSRGGYLMLAIGLLGRFMDWRALLAGLAVVAGFVVVTMNVSDAERFMFWTAAWQELTWWGHGAGSFANLIFAADDGLHYPGHVHNDYLQLAYELGMFATPVYAVYAAALARTESPYWPVFAAFAACCAFFFPLYAPVTGLIGAVLAGHLICYDAAVRIGKSVNAAV